MMQNPTQVLQFYKAGDFAKVIGVLEPLANKKRLTNAAMFALLAQSLYKSGQVAKAAVNYDRAGDLGGEKSLAFYQLAFELFKKQTLNEDALAVAGKILRKDPHHRDAAMFWRHNIHYCLDMAALDTTNRTWMAGLERGDAFYASTDLLLNHVGWCADEAINARSTTMQDCTPYEPAIRTQRRAMPQHGGERIRIGYLSSDFSDCHATMMLFQGVMERHDPDRFDITLFCYTPESLKAADRGFRIRFSHIVEISTLSDIEAAHLIREHALDILVDLKGPTLQARSALVNMGLAPIQVAYLGFPGSAPGIDCDYVISDHVVTPDTSKRFYHEKLCRLPDCYQPNDRFRRPLPPRGDRAALGLPPDKIVFASFNQIRKISTETFAAWAEILRNVENSVLWMLCAGETPRRNFLSAMAKKGIGQKRIIFAGHANQETHLARLQAADIGLDTYPYNGHTTTSDKLWVGLPVVTKKGSHFASRVSESLLLALKVPELVADDQDGYVQLAVTLAKDENRRHAVRDAIITNRLSTPLFDTERYTRHLETAFCMMVDRYRCGKSPDHIDVPVVLEAE